MTVGKPLANYAAWRLVGGHVYLSGVIAVDPSAGSVVTRYSDLPQAALPALQSLGFVTGQMSVDSFEAPIVAQSWWVLSRIQELAAEAGVPMKNAVRLVQYFRDLRDYPHYNRVRSLFFEEPVVSTVVEVSRMLPNDQVLVEVEATFYKPD
ncbi:MAG: RidA family protein [Burkholderiales bacterium]|nr:RidA family protein [Burkholderiales bacterium]